MNDESAYVPPMTSRQDRLPARKIAALFRKALGLALLCAAFLASGQGVAETTAPPGGTVPASAGVVEIIASVSPEGEFTLRSGRRAKLLDVRLPETGAAAAPARDWLSSLSGQSVRLEREAGPDRWGRVSAALALVAPPVDVAELLVGEGWAVVDAGERSDLIRPDLLAIEARARAARRGLWRDSPWPLRADATDDLAAASGRFALVEGRVVSVGERRDRTYLNFGRDWSRSFAVTVPKRIWATLKERGVSAARLTGATVRVRGILEMRRAPDLDIVVPDMLEVVAEAPARPPSRARER